MLLHPYQKKVILSPARFKIIRAGRRSGKTTLETEDMSFEAVSEKDSPIFYIAPTQTQARAIIWEALKARLIGIGQANEQRLEMTVPTQDGGKSIITVAGWENRENFRGRKAKKIYFDEVDTMKDFFIGWQEIFRPALTDLKGKAIFSGTPKKENPNLRRLEKISQTDKDYECFHFTTKDNPFIDPTEIGKAQAELDNQTFRQEILAEYLDNVGSLFKYEALIDVFTNTITKKGNKYLIVDIADDGTDKTIFSFWEDLEEYRREEFARLNTEGIINQIREYSSQDRIPYSHIAVDAIGVGAGVASSSKLDGIVGFKSSFSAFKTDLLITRLPNVGYVDGTPLVTDFRNLRSQCIFTLAERINNHQISSKLTGAFKEKIIEELSNYQDISQGDGKRQATGKEQVKEVIGRSPDHSDTWLMRMYFEVLTHLLPNQDPISNHLIEKQRERMQKNKTNFQYNSNK